MRDEISRRKKNRWDVFLFLAMRNEIYVAIESLISKKEKLKAFSVPEGFNEIRDKLKIKKEFLQTAMLVSNERISSELLFLLHRRP